MHLLLPLYGILFPQLSSQGYSNCHFLKITFDPQPNIDLLYYFIAPSTSPSQYLQQFVRVCIFGGLLNVHFSLVAWKLPETKNPVCFIHECVLHLCSWTWHTTRHLADSWLKGKFHPSISPQNCWQLSENTLNSPFLVPRTDSRGFLCEVCSDFPPLCRYLRQRNHGKEEGELERRMMLKERWWIHSGAWDEKGCQEAVGWTGLVLRKTVCIRMRDDQ